MKTSKHILIIEDEASIVKFLQTHLVQQKFTVFTAMTAAKGLRLVSECLPDIILLDLTLPDLDGLKVIQQLREWTTLPIVVLSAREQERDKILALDLGADDYLTKPFGVQELMARVRVALRHAQNKTLQKPVFKTGQLRVDLVHRRVWVQQKEIALSPIQYQLLAILVRQAGKVVTHQQLLREIWGEQRLDATDYLRIYVHQLRQKLEEDPVRPKYLHTEAGVGYRLREFAA